MLLSVLLFEIWKVLCPFENCSSLCSEIVALMLIFFSEGYKHAVGGCLLATLMFDMGLGFRYK